jgi:mono/diheme cytochrome c family protein
VESDDKEQMRRPMTEISRIRLRRVIVAALLTVAEAACAGQEIPPEQPPVLASFSASAIANGATLAALGDCAVCHTAPDGSPYAGGQGIQTPFGTVYATNITPDPTTGIGQWTLDAFRRAMRDGIDREGRHLYPVLPYPHFIHATDDDIAAMYAFLMTREPVTRQAPKNHLTFPFNWRPLLAAWNAWFLRPGIWQPDAAHDAEWNRGAYLVDAIGHCGACHTPHNAAGAEQRGQTLAGGEAEGWFAPALATNSQAPVPWSVDALTGYLRTGFDAGHGAAAGPMALVTHQLAAVPDTDVRAMAVYIGSLMPPKPAGAEAAPRPRPVADPQTTAIFDGACGACHGGDAPMTRNGAPSLALSTAINAPASRNVVDVILHGLPWREGHAGPYMPPFSDSLTDAQVASLAAYVRARYTVRQPWQDIDATVREARRQGGGS